MSHTVEFGDGLTATYNPAAELVAVGDRWVPPEIFVSDPGHASEPALRLKIEVRQGIPVYTEVRFSARENGPDIRQGHLKIPLDAWLEQIVAACSAAVAAVDDCGRWTMLVQPPWETDRPAAVSNVRRTRKGRPRGAKNLEKIAAVYRENAARPTHAVARAFGVSHRTAARYADEARAAGLLPPTTPGKKSV